MLQTLSFVLYVLSMALSIASLLFGAVSWILMKKWRQFRHFTFMSFIVSGAIFLTWMYAWAQMEMLSVQFILTTLVIIITHIQMSHWQLITTIMIYKDLVSVFNTNEVKCKYLYACLFAWLLPVIEGIAMVFALDEWLVSWFVVAIVELSFMVANVVMYVRVVCSLVRLVMRRKISAHDVYRKILVSTLACVTAGVPPIVGTILIVFNATYGPFSLLDVELAMMPNLVNLILANLFFLSMKSHRLLWMEYIGKIRNTRAARRELDIQRPRHEPPVV